MQATVNTGLRNYEKTNKPPQKTKIPYVTKLKAPFSTANGIKRTDEEKDEGDYFSSSKENKILSSDLATLCYILVCFMDPG